MFLATWECLKWNKSSKQLSHLRKTQLHSFENVCVIILNLNKWKDKKGLGEAVYKCDKEEKEMTGLK